MPQNVLEWFAGAQYPMRVKEYVETRGIQRFVKLCRNTAGLYSPITDEEPSLFPKETETLEYACGESFKFWTAVSQRHTVEMGDFGGHDFAEFLMIVKNRDEEYTIAQQLGQLLRILA